MEGHPGRAPQAPVAPEPAPHRALRALRLSARRNAPGEKQRETEAKVPGTRVFVDPQPDLLLDMLNQKVEWENRVPVMCFLGYDKAKGKMELEKEVGG